MDEKTKHLVNSAEALAGPDMTPEHANDGTERMIRALCLAVKEQDKRARHAEEERDCREKYVGELKKELKAMQSEWLGTIAAVAKELAAAGFVDESGGDGIVIAVRNALAKQKAENERLRDRLATIGAYFGEDFTKP